MDLKAIEDLLSKLMVGATLLSLKLAGPELELSFVGGKLKNASSFSIDTDAWIFVADRREDIDVTKINDEAFFSKRPEAIIGLYELTGYDVGAVSVRDNGFLELMIGDKVVLVCPVDGGSSYGENDSWDVVIEDSAGKRHGYIGFYQGQGFTKKEPA